MVRCGIPARAAPSSPAASGRLLTTRTISAGYSGSDAASISACKFDPRPEINTPTLSRAIALRYAAARRDVPGCAECRWRPRANCAITASVRKAATIRDRGRFAMTLPLRLARIACRGGWRSAGAALLILLGIHAAGMPVRAQEAQQISATVKVDATAETTAKAREMARLDG